MPAERIEPSKLAICHPSGLPNGGAKAKWQMFTAPLRLAKPGTRALRLTIKEETLH